MSGCLNFFLPLLFFLRNMVRSGRYISCTWIVTSADGEEHFKRSGCSGATVQFTRAPYLYIVDLKLTAQDLSLGTHRFNAMCKYVRREIRALTREDRRRYFSALEQVHRLGLAEGRAKYGERFVNYRHFTAKHLDATTPNECFPYVGPYHGANSFLTSHGAFTLELEQALQSVDQRVSQPYWDFTIDAGALGVNWLSSQIFDDDWFAAGSTSNSDHIAGNGSTYFSSLPVPEAGDFVVRNSYGRLTHPVNQDSVSFVTRGDSICGLPTKSKLAGKDEILGCMAIESLGEWRACLEVEVHAYAHTMIGGVWDCPFSFESFLTGTHPDDKLAVGRAEFLALNSINLWKVCSPVSCFCLPSVRAHVSASRSSRVCAGVCQPSVPMAPRLTTKLSADRSHKRKGCCRAPPPAAKTHLSRNACAAARLSGPSTIVLSLRLSPSMMSIASWTRAALSHSSRIPSSLHDLWSL